MKAVSLLVGNGNDEARQGFWQLRRDGAIVDSGTFQNLPAFAPLSIVGTEFDEVWLRNRAVLTDQESDFGDGAANALALDLIRIVAAEGEAEGDTPEEG